MSETLSAIVSTTKGGKTSPALYVGLAGDAPTAAPARLALAGLDRVDIGRGDTRRTSRARTGGAEVTTLTIADGRMSSQHARLSRLGTTWVLEDVGSKNGTWIGAERVTRRPLGDGDGFVVGHTAFVFRVNGGEVGDSEALPPPLAPGLATMSPSLAARFTDAARAALTAVPIEITGESGTGKELFARAIHTLSKRSGRFVAVNCGALPANLIEAELFGHKKGAFTGAGDERTGLVRNADGGTLFLDEVGELPLAAQTSLLRVLQEREVLPIGADRPIKVDLRIVTATHRDLDADVATNRFRADLRARLLGVAVELPPLRTRREDLGHLISALLERLAPDRAVAFSADAIAALYAYAWPLNIRELERALAAALAVSRDRIELPHLSPALRAPATPSVITNAPVAIPDDDDALRALLVQTIERHDGNLAAVARELGKDRTQIRRWMKRFGLARADAED
jgi:DNA-binding NtrC family response regulator